MPYAAVYTNGAAEPQRYELRESTVFGRSGDNGVCVDDPNVSRRHCKLERASGGEWILTDLDSTNGTWLDAARVRRYALRDGETFYIGDARVVFHTDRWIEHRPADPHEAVSAAQVFIPSRKLADACTRDVAKRPLPSPRATIARRGQYRRVKGQQSLAFRRAPAMPIVQGEPPGGWFRVMLEAVHGRA